MLSVSYCFTLSYEAEMQQFMHHFYSEKYSRFQLPFMLKT